MKIIDIAQYEDTDSELAKISIITLQQEIKKLNNIINKYDIFLKHELSFEGHSAKWIENKLQELKGDSICH